MLHVTVPTDPDKRRSSGLSRELVLHAALQIIDQDGVDGLSMRKLARALVVGSRIVRRPELGAALESLDHVDTRVLGLVLNKVQKEDEDRYGYGYEYTYDKIQASEPVRAKAAALVAPVAPAPARGIASSR